MTTDLDTALRAADPTSADDPLPSLAATLTAVRERTGARAPRRWPLLAVAAAVVVALAAAVPVLWPAATPPAAAAIRLAPFDGLMSPYVLADPPAGLTASPDGRDGSTSIAYVGAGGSADAVWVTHARTATTVSSDEPHATVRTALPDGTWLTVTGYGRYADPTALDPLAASATPAPRSVAVAVDVAPAGWRLAAFKGAGDGVNVLTISPSGGVDDADGITVVRYPTTAADFPAGYEGRGPTTTLTSLGRPGVLMQGTASWALQLRLPDGGSLVLLLPTRMDRGQVQRFADGVTTPP